MDEQFLKGKIRDIRDYPKEGIVFRDITPLIKDGNAFRMCIDALAERISNKKIDYIAGIEARGFIMGSALAYQLDKGFIPVRKAGKLPGETISRDYALEYGTAKLEMHTDSIRENDSVLIVDDLLATGGTAKAAADMITDVKGKVAAIEFLVELSGLKGREKLNGYDVISLIKY